MSGMKKKGFYLGIDLGSSSVKGIMMNTEGCVIKAKRGYVGEEPRAWFDAVKLLIAELTARADSKIEAIAFSSQVGTYVVENKEVISWRSRIGKEELDGMRHLVSDEEFIRHIGMKHPDLISYPLPRLMYIQKRFGADVEVLMPKELLIRELTGNTVTDVFSMRGVAHTSQLCYAEELIEKLGIKIKLPELKTPTQLAGYVTEWAESEYGISAGTPVYLGCNDFFAGLIGMGIYGSDDAFELSGTSAHIGYISDEINEKGFVSGGYFIGNCTYGGTKSSGASCDFAIKSFGINGLDIDRALSKAPPIFLPYLCGERAPIFDEDARGVYFGLNADTDREALAYSVLEGVVFSIYDVAKSMDMPCKKRLIVGGGSAENQLMNTLRAALFDCEVVNVCENDTSALGAVILAMVGDGVYPDIPTAIREHVRYKSVSRPIGKYKSILRERFKIYKELYGNNSSTFKKFNRIEHKKGDKI